MSSDLDDSLPPEGFFDQLYAAHRQALHAYFFGRTGDGEVALDLLQETFLRAWRNLNVLQTMPFSQHRYWLFTVARNLLTDYYRRQAVQTAAQAALSSQEMPVAVSQEDLAAQIATREQLQQVDRAIQQLPENLRTVLLMQVLGAMNSTQIGDILEIPAGTVRYQLAMARKQLAEALQLKKTEQIVKRKVTI